MQTSLWFFKFLYDPHEILMAAELIDSSEWSLEMLPAAPHELAIEKEDDI